MCCGVKSLLQWCEGCTLSRDKTLRIVPLPLSHTADRVQRNPLTVSLLIHTPKPTADTAVLRLLGECLAIFSIYILSGNLNEYLQVCCMSTSSTSMPWCWEA